jgi:dihydroorotate dehydrogenase electron transfer subunit
MAHRAPALPKTVVIKDVVRHNDRIVSLVLDDKIDCVPGQFVMLWLPRIDEKPYSVAIPDPLTVTFAHYGPFTEALGKLKPGDQVGWRGPLGNGFTLTDGKALVVAGGVGLASVSYLIRALRARGAAVDVVVGARTKSELYDLAEMEALGCRVHPTTDDGTHGFHGFTTDQSKALLAENTYDMAYACGPEIMMVKLQAIFDAAAVPYQFSLERYMKCGIGICDLCSIDGLLTCQDGPIFDDKTVAGMTEFGHVYRITTGEEVPAAGSHRLD